MNNNYLNNLNRLNDLSEKFISIDEMNYILNNAVNNGFEIETGEQLGKPCDPEKGSFKYSIENNNLTICINDTFNKVFPNIDYISISSLNPSSFIKVYPTCKINGKDVTGRIIIYTNGNNDFLANIIIKKSL